MSSIKVESRGQYSAPEFRIEGPAAWQDGARLVIWHDGAVSERLHLLLGDDDFLTGRVVESIVAERSAEVGADVPVTRVRAGDVTEHELAELLSPSLFAEERVIVVEAAADAVAKQATAGT